MPILIFDEIDVGIGDKIAEIAGYLLKKLRKELRILYITHLSQVAATGNWQWQVAKSAGNMEDQKVLSKVTVLNL